MLEQVGLLQPQEPKTDGLFVHPHAKGVADANGHVLDPCIPVTMTEHLPSHPIEAVGFVALQVVDEELVAEIARHQPVGACPRPL
jgi:hypothetical protein